MTRSAGGQCEATSCCDLRLLGLLRVVVRHFGGDLCRSDGRSERLDEDNEEQEDLWRKESRNPRQLSVRLILDGLSTRPAGVLLCCANTILERRYPISPLAPQSFATHLWNAFFFSVGGQERGECESPIGRKMRILYEE